jgi:hypothetical protein
MTANSPKIEIKAKRLPGVDLSTIDYRQMASVPIAVTKVTKKMWKKFSQAFVGIKDPLNAGEVIRFGDYGLTYKIVRFVRVTPEGRIFKIKRTDGANITQFDIDNTEVGMKVNITTRNQKDGMYLIP